MTPTEPVCYNCKHLKRIRFDNVQCVAFPLGIPQEIFYDGQRHDKPTQKQINDIVFEPIK